MKLWNIVTIEIRQTDWLLIRTLVLIFVDQCKAQIGISLLSLSLILLLLLIILAYCFHTRTTALYDIASEVLFYLFFISILQGTCPPPPNRATAKAV